MNHVANNKILKSQLLSPDSTVSAICNRQSELYSLLKIVNSRLSNAPDGTLRIARRGNAHKYYHRLYSSDRIGTYRNKSLVQEKLFSNTTLPSILNIYIIHLTKQGRNL